MDRLSWAFAGGMLAIFLIYVGIMMLLLLLCKDDCGEK